MRTTILLMAGALFITYTAMAEDHDPIPAGDQLQQLATITNDKNLDVSTLSLVVGDQELVQGVYFYTQHADPAMVTTKDFPLPDINTQRGVVLDGDNGHDAILLRGNIDSVQGHGDLVVSYLSNGITGSYKDCNVSVDRATDGKWYLINYAGQAVSKIVVKTWLLGIRTVQNICPE